MAKRCKIYRLSGVEFYSNHLGTDHTEMIISEKEMQEAIPQMGYYFSEPFGDASMIPTYFVSKIARQKVTVSLSGDAGDELFCGYEGYWKCDGFWDKINKIPMGLRYAGAAVLSPFDSISNPKLHRIIGTLQAQNICQLKDVIFDRKHVGLEKGVEFYSNHLIFKFFEIHQSDCFVKK